MPDDLQDLEDVLFPAVLPTCCDCKHFRPGPNIGAGQGLCDSSTRGGVHLHGPRDWCANWSSSDPSREDQRRARNAEQRRRWREERDARDQRRQEAEQERRLQGQREIARISAAHPLTGYDRNVLAQWERRGFCGKRPQLSFELQQQWQSEQDREQEEIERERQRVEALRQQQEEWRKEAERKRLEREEWRRANPELAAQQDAEEAAERERRRQEAEARRQIEAMERALEERKTRIRAFVYHHSPQELNAEDFLFWAETIASPEELEGFDNDCIERARGKPAYATAWNFFSWLTPD